MFFFAFYKVLSIAFLSSSLFTPLTNTCKYHTVQWFSPLLQASDSYESNPLSPKNGSKSIPCGMRRAFYIYRRSWSYSECASGRIDLSKERQWWRQRFMGLCFVLLWRTTSVKDSKQEPLFRLYSTVGARYDCASTRLYRCLHKILIALRNI